VSARSTLVREHCEEYSLHPSLIHGVLSAATGVDLEGEQFICHVDNVLVPEVVGSDIYDLWTFGVLNQAACLRHSFQLTNQPFGLLGRDDPFCGSSPVVSGVGGEGSGEYDFHGRRGQCSGPSQLPNNRRQVHHQSQDSCLPLVRQQLLGVRHPPGRAARVASFPRPPPMSSWSVSVRSVEACCHGSRQRVGIPARRPPPIPGSGTTGNTLACATHLARALVSTGWNRLCEFPWRLSGKSNSAINSSSSSHSLSRTTQLT
jgi:hypothetical protein